MLAARKLTKLGKLHTQDTIAMPPPTLHLDFNLQNTSSLGGGMEQRNDWSDGATVAVVSLLAIGGGGRSVVNLREASRWFVRHHRFSCTGCKTFMGRKAVSGRMRDPIDF